MNKVRLLGTGLVLFSLMNTEFVLAQSTKNDVEKALPPRYAMLGSFSSNDVLKLDCSDHASTTEVTCKEILITINRMSEKEKTDADKGLDDIDKVSDADFQKTNGIFTPESLDKMKRRLQRSTQEQAAYSAVLLASLTKLDGARDRAAFKSTGRTMNAMEADTCNIRTYTGATTYERVSPYRWISNPGPRGICDVVTVAVLESTKQYPGLWKQTVTTLSANTDLKSCEFYKDSLNKPTVYSWDYPQETAPSCKYLRVR